MKRLSSIGWLVSTLPCRILVSPPGGRQVNLAGALTQELREERRRAQGAGPAGHSTQARAEVTESARAHS